MTTEQYMRKTEKGVTLIELMTVMVVLGILTAIAVPSYRRYLLRAQRSDASTALLRLQTSEEKFLLQNGVYTTNLTNKPSDTTPGLGIGSTSERGFYVLEVKLSATGYTATAKPNSVKGGQSDDKTCTEFSVSETGVKKAKDSSSKDRTAECWR